MEPSVQALYDKEANKTRKMSKDRWYSRIGMWYQAKALKLTAVDDMTDEQFDESLQAVHDHLRRHSIERSIHNLEANKGPASSEERHSAAADYVGHPKRYQYYSF